LTVDHSHGDVEITTHREAVLSVEASIRVSASDREAARRLAEEIRIEVAPDAGGVAVKTVYPQQSWTFPGIRSTSFSVDYRIVMPENATLGLRNRFGDVSVTNLKAAGDLFNSNGKLVFRQGAGPQRLENSFGSVELLGNAADAAIVNANGSVAASDVQGDLDVRNRFGRTEIARVGKRCTVTTQQRRPVGRRRGLGHARGLFRKGGRPQRIGNAVRAKQHGSVTAASCGKSELETSFGAISFSEMRQGVVATGSNSGVSGRASAAERPFGRASARSSSRTSMGRWTSRTPTAASSCGTSGEARS
jgi:hypothetical protein